MLMYGVADAAMANAPLTSSRPLLKPADAEKRALRSVEQLISKANLGGKVSFAVADALTGEMIETEAPLVSHPPASVTKAATSLFALERLGAARGFRTQLVATGEVQNGVLSGDLVLVGGGDPTLDTDALYDMAAGLKERGVHSVAGKFKVYGKSLPKVERIDKGQPEHVGYNPAISGLNLNFNRVYLEWKRAGQSYSVTMDGRTERFRPGVGFAETRVVDRSGPIFEYSDQGGRDNWSVARRALGRGGGRWLPVRRPEIYSGDVFQTLARSHGITLPFPELSSEKPTGSVLVEHVSQDLQTICKDMLKFSTNLTAEVVGLSASGASGLEASAGEMSRWMGERYGLKKAAFVDHSGLGDASKMTAVEMVKALTGGGAQATLQPILKRIPTRDTENRVDDKSPVQIVAKTGTLNFVSALAGYVRTEKGRDLAFAIFMSDVPRRRALSKSEKENPRGAKGWNGRAKRLQGQLINRWAVLADA